MTMFLYHAILPEDHDHHVSIEEIMSRGINYSTKSNNWYGNGGEIKSQIADKLKPLNAPIWVNFQTAIGVNLEPHKPKSFYFPVFTEKILVFDGNITMNIYDQSFYEDNKFTFEEALDFDTGESLEHWINLYWNSMMTLEEYLLKKPYLKPEVLVFESIPKEIIGVCENS
ncbi:MULTISPECIES: DNA polymerase III [Brevibacillus]|uniref:DNA polymerase III n=1 Tax=Brevibacillus TaxID=55080 RepID=UPI001C8E5EC9|nr:MULTISPECIES: DNA polymerase III [Brevibacillus]MBY0086118.1 DNA polymerase III [Brevibacillus brevis]MCE0450102.1 DNA polymerase III [Brevibacillus sp. AF8]UKL00274.1 DNA polymerase III [Brevibacillus brevis]